MISISSNFSQDSSLLTVEDLARYREALLKSREWTIKATLHPRTTQGVIATRKTTSAWAE